MATCSVCNIEVGETDAFCKHCGAQLNSGAKEPAPSTQADDFLSRLPGVHFTSDQQGGWQAADGTPVQLEMPPATVAQIHSGPDATAFEKWRQSGRLNELTEDEIEGAKRFVEHSELSPIYKQRLVRDLLWWDEVSTVTFGDASPEHVTAIQVSAQVIVHRVHSAYDRLYDIRQPAADVMLDTPPEILQGELATLCFWSAATLIVKQITQNDSHGRAFYQFTARRFPGLDRAWPGRVDDYNPFAGAQVSWDGLGNVVATKAQPAVGGTPGLDEVAHAFGQEARSLRYDVDPYWQNYPFQPLPIKRRER